ncbi:MAG TPA: nitroreductase family protein [Candidatus Hydrogenedentes bacterium]|nr:nitroreductase family protein [Candidatus Hydrogenedentota bacterium]
MDAIEALTTRRSVRIYESKPVPESLLETMVDCGRLAATARNAQVWEFVVVTTAEGRSQIAEAADHGKFIANAGACIAVFCRESDYYLEDGCAATQNMLVAARALGLGTCWVAGDKKAYAEKVRTILSVPAGYNLVSLIAVGYPAQVPIPIKRELQEVLHWERY